VAVRSGDKTLLLVLCAGFVAVAFAGIMAITAGGSRRASVYSQLERPASFGHAAVGPAVALASVDTKSYHANVSAFPNRAGSRNQLSIVVTRAGRPLDAARVTVTYSMDAMNMHNVYTGRLAHTAGGTYSAIQPVFGMPGVWNLRFHVTPAQGAPVTLTVNDRMRS
jgi:YtkA-like